MNPTQEIYHNMVFLEEFAEEYHFGKEKEMLYMRGEDVLSEEELEELEVEFDDCEVSSLR